MDNFHTAKLLFRLSSTVFIVTVILFIFCGTILQAQDYGFNPALTIEGTDSNVKSISAKYAEGRVYLMVIISGIKNDRYYIVKRSVDGNYFENIGSIKCHGTPVPIDMMYSFKDNYPVYSFIYYKIVHHTENNDSVYSKTIGVMAGTDKSNLFVTIADDIWVINQKNDKMIPFKLDINTKETDCNATLSPDGNTLYFVSDRKGGYGGKDIWASEMLSNGQWNEPYNLGKEINSAEDEEYPLMLEDAATLFYSIKSEKPGEIYNAYFSTQNDEGLWGKPEKIELLQGETKDYFSVISNNISGKAYTYHVRKEHDVKNPSGIPSEKNK
ncbi:MAG: hypothetical protein V1904_13990 [Bacteroidota bacterium]